MDPYVCPCPAWPMMLWCLPDGRWMVGQVIDEQADPIADSAAYEILGCVAWVATCPQCGCLFDAGVTHP